MFRTFMVFERQFPSSWLHSNIRLLPGVIVPVFIEFTDTSTFPSEIVFLNFAADPLWSCQEIQK